MSYLRLGRRVRIQWERGGTWQDRILLCECQSSECEAELELTPSEEEILGRRVWYALTPDLDVYPHILSETQLVGFVALTNDGPPISETGFGKRWRAASAAYGADWEPTALEVCEALDAVRPGCLSPQGDEKPSRRLRGKVSSKSTPAAAAATNVVEGLYPGLLAGTGALPDVGGLSWYDLSADDATQLRQAVRSRDFDGYLIVDKVGIATKGTECLLVKAVDPSAPGPELESDARVLDIKSRPDGSRHRHFTETARQVTTTEWPEWPILGPRTASWCLEFLARQDQHPRARRAKWVHECRPEATDEGVGGHDLPMRMAELGLSFDQLNLGGELASFELLMRKAQMAEWRHRDRLAAVQGDDLMEESYLHLGTGETRGLVMVALALVDHINQEMHREAQILKGRRKAKGESLLSCGGGGGGIAGSRGSKAELRKKIQQQAAELKKLQDRGPVTQPPGLAPRELLPLSGFAAARGADGPAGLSSSARSRVRRRLRVANWIADAVESLSALCGRGGARDHFSVSAGQRRSLEFMQSIIKQAGPPPCSPAAAHAELCGHRSGCDTEPELPAQCQREILSLPGPGARCDPSDDLCGFVRSHDQWAHWGRHLLRRTPAPDYDIKLRNDRNLMADRRCYAQFVLDLYTSGVIRVGAKRSATVGAFCVWKSGRQRLGLLFDTLRANARFHDPDHSQLPSAAAWAALRTEPTSSLNRAQADVDRAFYRVKLPDKMDEHFSLPSVHLGTLRQLADEAGIDMGLPEARFGLPLLQVLPMGWSWSLYFCQRLLGAAVLRSGIDTGPLIKEVGLKCKGVMELDDLQTFTGITFERRSARIGISAARMWRVRLALLFVADRRSATRGEISSLLGHFAVAALLRRPLLSIFQQTYVFARVAGRRRLRLWSRVELELRQAAAPLVFAFTNSKEPGGTFVCASDASRGQAGSGGGCGVVGQTWATELVGHTAASAESWRCSVLGAIGARECAPGFDPVEGAKVGRHWARAGPTSFEGVGRAAIRDFSDWGVLFHGEFQRDEDIAVLGAVGAAIGIILVDNLGLALAVGKGRSPSITLNHVFQQLCGISIVTDTAFILRWIPLTSPLGSGFIARGAPALTPGMLRASEVRTAPAPQPAGPSSPGAAGLGGALHGDPCPLGGLAGLLSGPGGGGADSDSSSTSSSEFLSDGQSEAATSDGRGAPPGQGEGSPPGPRGSRSCRAGRSAASASTVYFQKEYLDFVSWARSRGLSTLGGDKAFAALKHYNPGLGLSSAAALERATAGLRGFRKLARGSTRAPVAWELLFAAVGIALHRGWRSFAIALALSSDAMSRLPSELVAMTRARLVAPAPRSVRTAWSLLLCPEELNKVSKTLGCDEGVVFSDEMPSALGPELARLARARTDRQPLWDFDTTAFNSKFRAVFDHLGHQDCHPCQVRHGGASLRAAVLGEKLADIQAILRHQSDNSTKRYARHVRYFVEVGKLSPEVIQFGREHQVYLDLFSGTGKVASWLERKSGYAVLRIDVAAHPAFDLSRRAG
ncbi:unnamed protein product [Prorocentrum cordatum]|uniref:Uncharacterized protein n=1 Tax=Prorocentrum cordatum TaxID=2364126 RepID=A0ABN9VVJ0_9DINO|nr:unnamed protein product [Polarella glacialis]